jgi:hypothetical protein
MATFLRNLTGGGGKTKPSATVKSAMTEQSTASAAPATGSTQMKAESLVTTGKKKSKLHLRKKKTDWMFGQRKIFSKLKKSEDEPEKCFTVTKKLMGAGVHRELLDIVGVLQQGPVHKRISQDLLLAAVLQALPQRRSSQLLHKIASMPQWKGIFDKKARKSRNKK